MAWYAVYHPVTGDLVSVGTLVTDPELLDLVVKQYPDGPNPHEGKVWNRGTREFEPRPPDSRVDRLQDAVADPTLSAAWSRMTSVQRTAVRKYIVWLLGSHRYRYPNEEVPVDPPEGFWTSPTSAVE